MSFEAHYSYDSIDSIHASRQRLTDYAIEHFIRTVRRLYGIRLAPRDIKIGYEREQPAPTPSRFLHVELLEIIYRGKQHYARKLASENLRIFRYDPPERYENKVDETYASDESEEDSEDDVDEDYDDDDSEGDSEEDSEDDSDFEEEDDD
jgi:hypothetical protein